MIFSPFTKSFYKFKHILVQEKVHSSCHHSLRLSLLLIKEQSGAMRAAVSRQRGDQQSNGGETTLFHMKRLTSRITSKVKVQNHRARNRESSSGGSTRNKRGESSQRRSSNNSFPPGFISQWFAHARDNKSFPN